MKEACLAVDIGASSGRVIAGYVHDSCLRTEEIHRFDNGFKRKNGHDCWDISYLFEQVKIGIKKSGEYDLKPVSLGIDTWAVDFVLLDENGDLLTDAVAYRDSRTDGMMADVFKTVPKEEIYKRTGIQFLKFNTLYQLYYLKKTEPEILEKASSFLMVPDYLNYMLTGVMANEYTNATSTQLLHAESKQWDDELLETLGINRRMFQEIAEPGTKLGTLKSSLVKELGVSLDIVLPATHDTGSAVVAVPETDRTIYLSSGTWSLMGVESASPDTGDKAFRYNFTNEGGFDYRFRFLKNIMGLWMIQEVKRLYQDQYSYADLVSLAEASGHFHTQVNVDDDRFLNPENMIEEIKNACRETGRPVPETPGETAKCVFDSLVSSYSETVRQLEEVCNTTFDRINVIGGGAQNQLINQLIADGTGKTVISGPVEATALGNLLAQFIATGKLKNLEEARALLIQSTDLKTFKGRA